MKDDSLQNSTAPSNAHAGDDTLKNNVQSPKKVTFRDPEIGERLGSGICKEKIGEGGMGRVYRIWSTKYEIERAIKLIPNSANPMIAERFVREAKLSIQLNHPNIVSVYDYSNWNGFYYIEMEYINGESLDYIINRDGPFDIISTCAIGIIIGEALHKAHTHTFHLEGKKREGLIHRDLKPANIMLSDKGTVKLMDFGIARPLGETVTRLTTENGIVGSFYYMPPEQLEATKDIDRRVDIYALGTVLYELLTGKTAFYSDNLYEVKRLKTSGEYRPIRELNPDVPERLEKIIDKSIQVNAKHRYPDIPAFTVDLTTIFSALTTDSPQKVLENRMTGKMNYTSASEKIVKMRAASPTNRFQMIKKPAIISASILLVAAVLFLFIKFTPIAKTPEVTVPVLIAPVDKVVITDPHVSFSWHQASPDREYFLQIALLNDFSDSIFIKKHLSDTVLIINSLPSSRQYFWRVRNAGKDIRWSETGSFVFSGIPPSPPVVLTPANGSIISSKIITFRWKLPENTAVIRFQLARDSNFSSIVTDTITDSTSITLRNFKMDSIWYWRIGSISKETSNPVWGTVMHFTISIKETVVLPSQVDTLSLLRTRYNSNNLLTIVQRALNTNKFNDAQYVLCQLPTSDTRDSLILRLAEKIFDNNLDSKADNLLDRFHLSTDGFAHLCRGKRLYQRAQFDKAIQEYEMVRNAPTILNNTMLQREALYGKALITEAEYRKHRTESGREQAKNAYLDVVRFYRSNNLSADSFKVTSLDKSNIISKEKLAGD